MTEETAVIIGAGPAGLTAALEILRRRSMKVIVLEASNEIGGISRTVNHNGNRIDIGGHRFFSKSDWVMDWWRDILPVETDGQQGELEIAYQNKRRTIDVSGDAPARPDEAAMLVRNRLSRIYFNGKFFSYPLKADFSTAMKLGPLRVGRMIGSYAAARAFPRAPEDTLEDFLVNRFGNNLYQTFFREYTEKVWGVPCNQIGADWGARRPGGDPHRHPPRPAARTPALARLHQHRRERARHGAPVTRNVKRWRPRWRSDGPPPACWRPRKPSVASRPIASCPSSEMPMPSNRSSA